MSEEFQIEFNKIYRRREDMSPTGELRLLVQPDGDVIIECYGEDFPKGMKTAQVEFTFPGIGGGRSPNTRNALINLIEAIELDNKIDQTGD